MANVLSVTWFLAVVHSGKLWEGQERSTKHVQPVSQSLLGNVFIKWL